MKYIEKGLDKEGNDVWFVLEDAELIGMYETEEEANNNI